MSEMDTGNIEVFRESSPIGRIRTYRILADSANVAAIKNGETVSIKLPKGMHEILVKLDWTKSNPVTVNIEPGQTIKLTINYKRQKGTKYVVLTAIFVALFLVGAILGIPAIIGLGIGGFMMCRVGKLHLCQTDQT